MDKKHISILSISLNTGGAERVISLLLKELVKDYKVTLVLLMDDVAFDIPEEVGLKILGPSRGLVNVSPFFKIIKSIGFIFRYRRLLKRERIELSMSFLALPNMINVLAGRWLIGGKRPRIVISERCFPSEMYADSGFARIMAKNFYPLLYNKSDLLFSNSIHINNDLEANFGVSVPMKVIYNPIEVEPDNPFIDEYAGELPFQLINVGSHIPVKDQSLILKAMHRLDARISLTLLGSGPLTEELKKLSRELGIGDSIKMPGRVSDVKRRLSQQDCFVLSSKTEGFPNVLLEAMAAGLPVISTNCNSGPLEILNNNNPVNIKKGGFYRGKYGILVNVGDAPGLAAAINFLSTDSEKRKEYSNLSHERALDFNLDVVYKEFKSVIESQI